jgi:hypothetical protein
VLIRLVLLILVLISLVLLVLILASLILLVLISLVLHVGLVLILPLATALGGSALDIARCGCRSTNGGRYRLVGGLGGKRIKRPHFDSIIRTYFLQVFLHHLLAFWDLVLAFRTKSESGP